MFLSVMGLYPILWILASSFKKSTDVFKNAYSLVPTLFNFDNYIEGWRGFARTTFGTFFSNTFFLVITITILTTASSACIAYGFARIKFAGKRIWFLIMMVTMMLPSQVVLIPQYVFFSRLNWINTYKPFIIPAATGGPFFVFLIMQFIQTIPMEIDESAKIDGCSKYRIFISFILPLITPAIITSVIFQFYWGWQDFFGPLIYLNTPSKYTVSVALKLFSDPDAISNWGALFAMSFLSLIPVFIIFFTFQRYIVEGISTTGLKG